MIELMLGSVLKSQKWTAYLYTFSSTHISLPKIGSMFIVQDPSPTTMKHFSWEPDGQDWMNLEAALPLKKESLSKKDYLSNDLICGIQQECSKVFSPCRSHPEGAADWVAGLFSEIQPAWAGDAGTKKACLSRRCRVYCWTGEHCPHRSECWLLADFADMPRTAATIVIS